MLKFKDFADSEQYRTADPAMQQKMRDYYFETYLSPRIPAQHYDREKARFMELTGGSVPAAGGGNDGFLGGLYEGVQSALHGGAHTTSDMVSGGERMLGGDGQNAATRGLDAFADSRFAQLDPESQKQLSMEMFPDDPNQTNAFGINKDLSGYGAYLKGMNIVGSFVPSAVPGGLAARGGAAMLKGSKLFDVAGKTAAVKTAADADRVVRLNKNIDRASFAGGYGVSGLATIGGGTAEQVRRELENATYDELNTSPQFQTMFNEALEKTGGNDPQFAFQMARRHFAQAASDDAFVKGGALGFVSMAIGGPLMDRLMRGLSLTGSVASGAGRAVDDVAGKIPLGRGSLQVGKGGMVEGTQEGVESAGQQLINNTTQQDFGLPVDTMRGVRGAGLEGVLSGGIAGSTIATGAGVTRKVFGVPGEDPLPTRPELEQHLTELNSQIRTLEMQVGRPDTDPQWQEKLKDLQLQAAQAREQLSRGWLKLPAADPVQSEVGVAPTTTGQDYSQYDTPAQNRLDKPDPDRKPLRRRRVEEDTQDNRINPVQPVAEDGESVKAPNWKNRTVRPTGEQQNSEPVRPDGISEEQAAGEEDEQEQEPQTPPQWKDRNVRQPDSERYRYDGVSKEDLDPKYKKRLSDRDVDPNKRTLNENYPAVYETGKQEAQDVGKQHPASPEYTGDPERDLQSYTERMNALNRLFKTFQWTPKDKERKRQVRQLIETQRKLEMQARKSGQGQTPESLTGPMKVLRDLVEGREVNAFGRRVKAIQEQQEKERQTLEGNESKKPEGGSETDVTSTNRSFTEAPVDELTLSDDVPQFKSGANASGVVEPLGGQFDRTGVSPIQVWVRSDGRKEVISGRHRLDLAKRSGEQTIPAQYHHENDGFTADHAAALDAVLNIRDGQGKVKDYVGFFKQAGLSQKEAESEGLLARQTGRRAYTIATQGSDPLIAAHSGGGISDEGAERLAKAAPNNEKLQAVGIKALQDGKPITVAENMVRAVQSMRPPGMGEAPQSAGARTGQEAEGSTDLFGFDDSALQEAERLARAASKKQNEIQKSLSAVQGAAKRPDLAAKEGVDVRDPEGLNKRIEALKQEKDRWSRWHTDPELTDQLREPDKFDLNTQSEDELAQQAEQQKQQDAQQKQAEQQADNKAKADRDRDDFGLTGSDLPADANPDQGDLISEPGATYNAQSAPHYNVPGIRGLSDAQRNAVKRFLAGREDKQQIIGRLKKLADTPWARKTIQAMLVRQTINDVIAGRELDYESPLTRMAEGRFLKLLKAEGEQGLWHYLHAEDIMGHPGKPQNAVNGSFVDCHPSKDCATFCYATKGHYAMSMKPLVKSEIVAWAVESDPVQAAQLAATDYKGTREFYHKKALRLFDLGDGNKGWLPFIQEMNRQGIRLQVFSKNPEFLREVPEKNWRALSIDRSNYAVAKDNPDLPIAMVFDGSERDIAFVREHLDRMMVILPIKQGRKVLADKRTLQRMLGKEAMKKVCPIDAGYKKIEHPTDPSKNFNCTKCDQYGGMGCFAGNVSKDVMAKVSADPSDKTIKELEDEIRQNPERFGGQQAAGQLLNNLATIRSAIQRGADYGTEAENGGLSEGKTGKAKGVRGKAEAVQIIPTKEVKEDSDDSDRGRRGVPKGADNGQTEKSDSDGERSRSDGDRTLYGAGDVSGEQRRQQIISNQRVLVTQEPTGRTLKAGTDTIRDVRDIAHFVAPIRKLAQEEMLAVVVDKDDKVINVIQHSKGQKDSASVSSWTLAGAVVATEGAKGVWFAHNHPTGHPEPSEADQAITQQLTNVLDGTGVVNFGHVVVGRGGHAVSLDADGADRGYVSLRNYPRSQSFTITERRLRYRKPTRPLNSTGAATEMIESITTPNAVVLLNVKNEPVGVLPLSDEDMKSLRHPTSDPAAARIIRALDSTNAVAVILKTGGSDQELQGAYNLGRFFNRFNGVTVLDHLHGNFPNLVSTGKYPASPINARGSFYSLRTTPAKGSKAPALRLRLAPLEKQLGVPVTVLQSETELPADLYRHVMRDRAQGRVRGMFDPQTGGAFVVADNLDGFEDAVQATLHELVGHKGVQAVLGKRAEKVFDQIYRDLNPALAKALRKRYARQLKGKAEAEANRIIAEEYLAHLAERDPKNKLLDKIVSMIRNALRRWFPKMEWTTQDAVELLASSRRALRKGRVSNGTQKGSRYSDSGRADTFYSAVERGAAAVKSDRLPAQSWLNAIKKSPNIQDEEIQWIGLDIWLDSQKGKKLDKGEVLEWIRANKVEIKEVPYGFSDSDNLSDRQAAWRASYARLMQEYKDDWVEHQATNYDIAWSNYWEEELHFISQANWESEYSYFYDTAMAELKKGVPESESELPGFEPDEYRDSDGDIDEDKVAEFAAQQASFLAEDERAEDLFDQIDETTRYDIARDIYENEGIEQDHHEYAVYDELGPYEDLENDSDNTRHETWTTKAGEDYAELLLTLPDSRVWRGGDTTTKFTQEDFRENVHWPNDTNVLAFVRFKTNTGDGKKELQIEEVQSDWHQRGSKRGYREDLVSKFLEVDAELRSLIKPMIGKIDPDAAINGDNLSIKSLLEQWLKDEPILHPQFVTGPSTTNRFENVAKAISEFRWMFRLFGTLEEKRTRDRISELLQGWQYVGSNYGYRMPNAPMRGSWSNMAMKRMIRYAAENGYDRILWTDAQVQKDRYSLQTHIKSLKAMPEYKHTSEGLMVDGYQLYFTTQEGYDQTQRTNEDNLQDYVGAELAEKIKAYGKKNIAKAEDKISEYVIRQLEDKTYEAYNRTTGEWIQRRYSNEPYRPFTRHYLLDEILKNHKDDVTTPWKADNLNVVVGGKGMDAFYDKRLPAFMKKYTKKWGGKVGKTTIEGYGFWSVDVTDKMRDSVMKDGQPLFALKDKSRYALKNKNDKVDELLDSHAGDFVFKRAKAEENVIQRALANDGSLRKRVNDGILPTMGLGQIAKSFGHVFKGMENEQGKNNPLNNYYDLFRKMLAKRNEILQDGGEINHLWGKAGKKHPRHYDRLATVMHRATNSENFPDKPFVPFEDLDKLRQERSNTTNEKKLADLNKRIKREVFRETEHAMLQSEYRMLPDDLKKVYKRVEEFYNKQWQGTLDALKGRVERSVEDGAARRAFLQNLEQQFARAKVRGPYFPLSRFGDFYLIAEKDGEIYRAHYDSANELKDAKAGLAEDGFTLKQSGLLSDFKPRKREGVSAFADALNLALETERMAKVPDNVKTALRDEINQIALRLLPDVSAAKTYIHRKGTKGYSANARRSFTQAAMQGARRLSSLEFHDRMDAELRDMEEALNMDDDVSPIDPEFRNVAKQVADHLNDRHESIVNPKGHRYANYASNFGFFMELGFSAGSGLVNLSQLATVTPAVLGAEFGSMTRAHGELLKALAAYGFKGDKEVGLRVSFNTLTRGRSKLPEKERKALEVLSKDGTLSQTQTHSLTASHDIQSKARHSLPSEAMETAALVAGYFFQNIEVMNREVTALAAYRMAVKKGQSHEEAIVTARNLTEESHFNYDDRPLLMKNNWVKVVAVFKLYAQNMINLYLKNLFDMGRGRLSKEQRIVAARKFFGLLGTHAVYAGTLGMTPFSALIIAAIEGAINLGLDDEDEIDLVQEYRQGLQEAMTALFGEKAGRKVADSIAKGVFNGVAGIDLHNRIGLQDIPFRMNQQDKSPREEWQHYVMEALGPVASRMGNMFVGTHELLDGHTQRGLEKIMPRAYRDVSKAIRYSKEGARTKDGKLIADGFSTKDIALQGLGISPTSVDESMEVDASVKNATRRINKVKRELEAAFVEAKESGSGDLSELRTKVRAWNKEHPDQKINMSKATETARRRKALKQELKKLKRNKFLNERVREERIKQKEAELAGLD